MCRCSYFIYHRNWFFSALLLSFVNSIFSDFAWCSFQADTCFLHCVVLLGTMPSITWLLGSMPSITWLLGTMPGIASASHVCTSITHFAQIGITCISGSENMHIEMNNTSFVRCGNKKIVEIVFPHSLRCSWSIDLSFSHVVYCLIYPLVHM